MLLSRNSLRPKKRALLANLSMFTRNPGLPSIGMNDAVPLRFTPTGP
jgi:hypothetical protein